MESYHHWVHGVATIVEAPEKTKRISHWGGNTWVDQEAKTYNWFHLAIPTPTSVGGIGPLLEWVHVHAHMNENARLAEVHIWDGGKRIHTQNCVFTDEEVDEKFGPKDKWSVARGINCCLKVEFLTGEIMGRATFYGAGGRFLA
ncbi:MAG: hypothetical protein GY856_51520 [bacterium]|nr:hypothetical protein [bacterium]